MSRDHDNQHPGTTPHGQLSRPIGQGAVRGFRLEVVGGEHTGTQWESTGDRCTIGFHPSCDLIIADTTVSRSLRIVITKAGPRVAISVVRMGAS